MSRTTSAATSGNMSDAKPLWIVDPDNSEKKLDKDRFSHMMNKRWKRIAKKGVSEAEMQAHERIIDTIKTQDIREIGDVPLPSSWAEVTALKILFPDDFLASNHAVVAQEKFPRANIGQWNPNEQGPTTALSWKKNKYRLQRANTVEVVQENSVPPKRSRSSEAAEEVEEVDTPFKKRRLASPIPIEDTITNTVTPQQETSPPPPSTELQLATEGSDDSEDSNEFWSEFDEHLAPIRKAVKEGSEITPRMLTQLRNAHLMELKKQRTNILIKRMTQRHARELRQVRSRYEGVITTWLKGIANGVKVLQKTRRELSLVEESVN
ncbi:Dephospho-CoA kinase cab5 [Fusarium irregulare]|uniref:Dephospho-CoA kinase cab5 n=1 Tax=Fusarium irregulare TaxID=2494466 RepID=A0A9W8U9P3_9HYPO|nr:Dephospho-CoA kinase cab5 [Fusarium irregulare]KAJ4021544.1 Dephospho-CoA kinase cab5 [Fusarium irregulare]